MDCEAVGGVGSAEFVQVGEGEGWGLGGEPQTLKPSHALVAPSLPLTERDKRVRKGGGLGGEPQALKPSHTLVMTFLALAEG